jgi:hypothetical protein
MMPAAADFAESERREPSDPLATRAPIRPLP